MMGCVKKWKAKELSALTKQLTAKDAATRFEGMGEARRNEAWAFLLAIVPVLIVGPIFAPFSEANTLGKILLILTGSWAGLVFTGMLLIVFRVIWQVRRAQTGSPIPAPENVERR